MVNEDVLKLMVTNKPSGQSNKIMGEQWNKRNMKRKSKTTAHKHGSE